MNFRNSRPADSQALQARLGGALAAALNTHSAALPHDITERLRAGREQALSRARFKLVPAVAAAPAIVARSASGAAVLSGGPQNVWRWKIASALPLLVLLIGLILIERWNDNQQVHAAAEIDSLLLADDLPPSAYTDPGFGEFLRAPRAEQP